MLQKNDKKCIQDILSKNMSHDMVRGYESMLSQLCTCM